MEIVVYPPKEWTATTKGGLYEKGEVCKHCGTSLRISVTDIVVTKQEWSRLTFKPGRIIYEDFVCPHCGKSSSISGEMSTEVRKVLILLNPEAYAQA